MDSQALALNWIAAAGVTCAALKLAMVNKVQNYESVWIPNAEIAYDLVSGDLQLNALVRDGSQRHWEAYFGNMCCVYLATCFVSTVLSAKCFRARQLMTKTALYLGVSLMLGTFSGFFAPVDGPGSIRWLVLLHLVILVWAFCKCHMRSNFGKVA